jgi:hypothetical protein
VDQIPCSLDQCAISALITVLSTVFREEKKLDGREQHVSAMDRWNYPGYDSSLEMVFSRPFPIWSPAA